MGPLSLSAGQLVYVDAQVVIYSVEQRGAWKPALEPLWAAYQAGTVDVVTSELSLLEVLVRPLREHDQPTAAAYRDALGGGLARMLPISPEVIERAARLRAAVRSLRTPDAIHAATAIQAGCVAFLSNDQGFRQVAGLPLVLLCDLASGLAGGGPGA